MPTSKKRVKKPKTQEEQALAKKSANIVKSKWGKIVIVVLALGFVLSLIVSLVYTLVQAMQA